ncbi:MAG: hypothetical protein V1899_07325 [Planctomycetota bacterium]
MSSLLAALPDWLLRIECVDCVLRLPWDRLHTLYVGEKLALGTLLTVSLLGSVVAINRLLIGEFHWPKPRKSARASRRKKRLGLKHLVLLLIALLPGGLVGTVTVYIVMGKDNWRRDAIWIIGLSTPLALLLALLRAEWLPWPQLSDNLYLSGLLGLIFALLQIWALIKLLRQWWGEPDECVPWWPPATLCLQGMLLSACVIRMLS